MENDLYLLNKKLKDKMFEFNQKEERVIWEKSLARGYFDCWRKEDGRDIYQLFMLKKDLIQDFNKFCDDELGRIEKLCNGVKKYLFFMEMARRK